MRIQPPGLTGVAARDVAAGDIGADGLVMADLFSGAGVAAGPLLGVGGDLVQHPADRLGVRLGERLLEMAESGRFRLRSRGRSERRNFSSHKRRGGGGGLRGIDQRRAGRCERRLPLRFLFRCGMRFGWFRFLWHV